MKCRVDASMGSSRKAFDKRRHVSLGKSRPLSRLQEALLITALISTGCLMQMLIVLKVANFGG